MSMAERHSTKDRNRNKKRSDHDSSTKLIPRPRKVVDNVLPDEPEVDWKTALICAVIVFVCLFILPKGLQNNFKLRYTWLFWLVLTTLSLGGPVLINEYVSRNRLLLLLTPWMFIGLSFGLDWIGMSQPQIVQEKPRTFWNARRGERKQRTIQMVTTRAGHDVEIPAALAQNLRRSDTLQYEVRVGLLGLVYTAQVKRVANSPR